MRKYINTLILILAFILPHLSASAQKLNSDGLKMVSRVNVKWYTREGIPWEGLTHDVYYQYDNEGKLIGVDNKFKSGKDSYVEQYRKEGNEIKYVKIKNGKADPYDTMRFILDKDGLIRYKIYDYAVYENNLSAVYGFFRYICHYEYSHSKPKRTDFNKYYKYQKSLKELGARIAEGWELSEIRRYDSMERACGMKEELHLYVDENGGIYRPEEHEEGANTRTYDYIDGNWYHGNSFVSIRNAYSDRLNDTNIEFSGLANITLNDPSRHVEWSTEWINARSKNLILFEKKRKNSNGAKTKYDYLFDLYGNLIQIKATRTEGGPNYGVYCIMDIEYLH